MAMVMGMRPDFFFWGLACSGELGTARRSPNLQTVLVDNLEATRQAPTGHTTGIARHRAG